MLRHSSSRRAILLAGLLGLPLAARAAADEPVAPASAKIRPRAERTAAERTALARRLRQTYAGPAAAWPAPHVDAGVEWRELGLLPAIEHPPENPYGTSKAALGRALFFDPRLSANGQMSCATCHEPSLGWADGRPVSIAHGVVPARNAPTVLNAAFQSTFFWDGRAASLEAQAAEALANPHEMAASPEHVIDMVATNPGYREWYTEAFPGRPFEFAAVVEAIACFERTLVGGRSRFDAFLRGDAADKGRFRTPSLRDVTHTAPYMHTGMFQLRGVLNMYNAGMATLKRQPFERDDPTFPVKSPLLKPLGLNRQDLADLEAFLGALAEPGPAPLPRHQRSPSGLE